MSVLEFVLWAWIAPNAVVLLAVIVWSVRDVRISKHSGRDPRDDEQLRAEVAAELQQKKRET